MIKYLKNIGFCMKKSPILNNNNITGAVFA